MIKKETLLWIFDITIALDREKPGAATKN